MSSVFADKDTFADLASTSLSVMDMLRKAGYKARNGGSSHKLVKHWSEVHGVPLPVYDRSADMLAKKVNRRYTEETILCENSTYNRYHLKAYLKKNELLQWKCATVGCELTEVWLGRPLVLQLEHKNGVRNDNRLENLELLCPNCHSQTATYAGKSR